MADIEAPRRPMHLDHRRRESTHCGEGLAPGDPGGPSGNVIRNVVPSVPLLTTSMVPACASTMARAMVSPRPAPGVKPRDYHFI